MISWLWSCCPTTTLPSEKEGAVTGPGVEERGEEGTPGVKLLGLTVLSPRPVIRISISPGHYNGNYTPGPTLAII